MYQIEQLVVLVLKIAILIFFWELFWGFLGYLKKKGLEKLHEAKQKKTNK